MDFHPYLAKNGCFSRETVTGSMILGCLFILCEKRKKQRNKTKQNIIIASIKPFMSANVALSCSFLTTWWQTLAKNVFTWIDCILGCVCVCGCVYVCGGAPVIAHFRGHLCVFYNTTGDSLQPGTSPIGETSCPDSLWLKSVKMHYSNRGHNDSCMMMSLDGRL